MIDDDIILDLVPLYRAGLGSPATRAAVEAWLSAQGEVVPARRGDDGLLGAMATARRLARWRRRWFAAAVTLTALCLSVGIDVPSGRVRLLALELPHLLAPVALAAVAAWLVYWRLRRRAEGG